MTNETVIEATPGYSWQRRAGPSLGVRSVANQDWIDGRLIWVGQDADGLIPAKSSSRVPTGLLLSSAATDPCATTSSGQRAFLARIGRSADVGSCGAGDRDEPSRHAAA